MDIREFYRSNQSKTNTTYNNQSTQNTDDYTSKSSDFSEYQDTINKYKDLSQEDLYSELITQADSLKSQGKLNMDMLNQISSTLKPMLNDEQKQMLNNIIERLK